MTYGGTSEVTRLVSQVGAASGTRTFDYTYDDRHQLTLADQTNSNYRGEFSYSTTGLLKTADVAGPTGAGTMVFNRNVTYDYNEADPEQVSQLSAVSSPALEVGFDYDASGNITLRQVDDDGLGVGSASEDNTLVYDAEQRLRRAEKCLAPLGSG